jgi:hypothetical protein
MKKICTLLFIFFAQILNAQTFNIIQQKCFGGKNSEFGPFGLIKENSLYIIGTTLSQNSGDVTDSICVENSPNGSLLGDLWYIKTDLNFNLINQKSYGSNGKEELPQILNSVVNNQLYIIAASSSDSSCEKSANQIGAEDIWMIEIDSLGQIMNNRNYGGNDRDDSPNSITFPDSSIIVMSTSAMVGGGNQTAVGYGNKDIWVFKLDKNKNMVWNKAYGGNAVEGIGPNKTLLKCSDSTFAFVSITSSSISGNVSLPSIGFGDFWFVYCDTNGNILNQKRFGGTSNEAPKRIIKTRDKGYLILGDTFSPVGFDVSVPLVGTPPNGRNIWLLKLDSLGNKQWDNRHGGSSNAGGDTPKWVEEAPDGGYWIASDMWPSTLNSNISEPGYGFNDVWMLKVDSLGNKVWDKRFGSAGNDYVRNFIILPDSSILIFAQADSGISGNKTVAGNGGTDYWLIHFKYTDTTSTVGFIDPIAFDESISLYPNPASDVVTIASNKTQIQNVTMYNLLGELIETKNYTSSHNIQFDLQTYPKGVYIAKITGQQSTVARKVVKN